jgi:hypothetical protein
VTDVEVRFHFLKAHDCKDFAVDGAFGGISGSGKIVAAFYTERPAIPTETVHNIQDGTLGSEIMDQRIVKKGLVRIVQSVAYFDLSSAISFHNWLGEKISEVKKLGAPGADT